MESTKNKAEQRRDDIIQMLNRKDTVTVQEFCDALNCSVSTIRNDLALMEKNGQLLRVFGGAVRTPSTPYHMPDITSRNTIYMEDKEKIAEYVAGQILFSGATIILDAGTTCNKIAEAIVEKNVPMTVLTCSLSAINILAASEQIDIYSFGGHFNKKRYSFFDEFLTGLSSTFHADMFFMGVDGVHPESGISITANDEINSKKTFIEMSDITYAVADHSKVGRISFRSVECEKSRLKIITDGAVSDDKCAGFLENGYEILRA